MRLLRFRRNSSWVLWLPPDDFALFLAVMAGIPGLLVGIAGYAVGGMSVETLPESGPFFRGASLLCFYVAIVFLLFAGLMLLFSAVYPRIEPPQSAIARMVRRTIGDPTKGNPLLLWDGQWVPRVRCFCDGGGFYRVRIDMEGTRPDKVQNAIAAISGGLTGKMYRYAVVKANTDVAVNFVELVIEDVGSDWTIAADTVDELRGSCPYLLRVDRRTAIDLRTSQSILVAGRTRSGKTYGIIALLLQVLSFGPDGCGSRVSIIDPKGAELSRIPGVFSPGVDGSTAPILEALHSFEELRQERQRYLNDLAGESGKAMTWWDAGMHVSLMFIDEFVACRSLFDSKQVKEFDAIVKRLTTMGASAGCYLVICVAQASVGEGGLPSMVQEACTTRVLFRPSMSDARLMWGSDMIADLPQRDYPQGAALFTTTDGVHESPSFVQFPTMRFPEMEALGELLGSYSAGWGSGKTPIPATGLERPILDETRGA